jgi:hypothetical protein
MAEGWTIVTRRADPEGGPDLIGRRIVRVSDQEGAVALVVRHMPDALVLLDMEASAQTFERYDVKPGGMLELSEFQPDDRKAR